MSKNKEKISSGFSQEKRERLKSILDDAKKEILSTSEAMEKIAPFVRELEKLSRSELKKSLSFTGPNNWKEDQGRGDYQIDNPHRYGFVDIDGLYDESFFNFFNDGLYFRIDTLEWDSFEGRYVPCQPTLKVNGMKIRLKLKKIIDPLRENARLYKKVLRDKKIYDNRDHYEYGIEHPRTRLDPETGKYVSERPAIKIRKKVRARKDSSRAPKNEE